MLNRRCIRVTATVISTMIVDNLVHNPGKQTSSSRISGIQQRVA